MDLGRDISIFMALNKGRPDQVSSCHYINYLNKRSLKFI